MPLVAPGRRNWESGVRVELFDGSLLWPPTNWKAMSNDERLQATEFAALSCLMPTRQEFRPRTRECLFDEFKFPSAAWNHCTPGVRINKAPIL